MFHVILSGFVLSPVIEAIYSVIKIVGPEVGPNCYQLKLSAEDTGWQVIGSSAILTVLSGFFLLR